MAEDNFTAGQIASTIWDVFYQAIFHAQPSHTRFVLPLCLLFLAFRIICFLREKKAGQDPDGQLLPCYLFHCGELPDLRVLLLGRIPGLFETLVPPLKGFSSTGPVFFNPFLWYAALFLIIKYLYDKKKKWIGNLLAFLALVTVVLTRLCTMIFIIPVITMHII